LELPVAFPARVARDVQQDVPQAEPPAFRQVFPLDVLQGVERAFLLVSPQAARLDVQPDVPPVFLLASPQAARLDVQPDVPLVFLLASLRVVQQDAPLGDYSAVLRWADQHDLDDQRVDSQVAQCLAASRGDPPDDHYGSEAAARYLDGLQAGC
jgi:hypothetical protein